LNHLAQVEYKPWSVEKNDFNHFAYTPSTALVLGQDGNCEVLRHTMEEEANDVYRPHLETEVPEEDLEDPAEVVELEARDIVREMLDSHENHVDSHVTPKKVIPFVQYGGNQIYKSTLVSQLNDNPFLSKDCLTRFRNSNYFNNLEEYIAAQNS
jgi:hypothetical protein